MAGSHAAGQRAEDQGARRRLYVSHKGAFMELLLDIEPGVSVLEYYR